MKRATVGFAGLVVLLVLRGVAPTHAAILYSVTVGRWGHE